MQNWRQQLLHYFAEYPAIDNSAVINAENTAEQLIHAAVLMPIIDNDERPEILFTVRSAALKHHAGHVSFPGGRWETADKDLLATALRETYEEIGLPVGNTQILGQLPQVTSSSNYLVTPFVGLVKPPLDLRLDNNEVSEAFTVPIDYLFTPSNYRQETYIFPNGTQRKFYVIEYGKHYIWGMTAGILRDFCVKLTTI